MKYTKEQYAKRKGIFMGKKKVRVIDLSRFDFKKISLTLLFFVFMFFIGMGIGSVAKDDSKEDVPISENIIKEDVTAEGTAIQDSIINNSIKEDSIIDNITQEDSIVEDSIKEDAIIEDAIKENTATEDSIIDQSTEDTVKEDSAIEDSAKENSVKEDSVKENSLNKDSDKENSLNKDSVEKTDSKNTVAIKNKEGNWGLGFGTEGNKPTGNTTAEELKKYDAYYVGNTQEKIIYLTFDCGYENGNTEKILDALKKHNVKATFFVVGHFLETAPDLVKRMVEDGNTVGNHTYHHYDMSSISSKEKFVKEMTDTSDLFKNITGQDMSMYYRPPQGKYSTQNLSMAKDLGYQTFFWSLAYVDWNQDQQPSHEEAFSKLTKRIHPGAIVLLHNTSQTNGEIIDELLTKWEQMGYTFQTLEDLIKAEK